MRQVTMAMNPSLLSISLLVAVLFLPCLSSGQEDITVEVTLNRTKIGMDERALLEVTVNGTSQDLPRLQIPTLSMFEVFQQGSSSNLSIVNGRMTSSETYRYVLLPTKPGVFPISNISVVYQNKRYKGNDVELTVVGQGSSAPKNLEDKARSADGSNKNHFMEAEVDTKNPFVNQQVTLTLKIYVGVRHSAPDLSWPPHTGFLREQLGRSTSYQQSINGRTYQVYEIKAALFPTKTGELEIGRALFTATVGGGFFRVGEEISARTRPIKVNVRPLPRAGRPDNFTGTIGNLQMAASVDKTEIEIGQPVTITVRISGSGNIKSVAEPIIPETDDFRIYLASSKENITKNNNRIGGTKIFEEVFVPKRAGNLRIPAMTYNFFNPVSRKYESIETRPVSIKVNPGEGYVEGDETPYAPAAVSIGSQAHDIRYIKQDIGDLRKKGGTSVFDLKYLLVNGIPVVLLIGMFVYRTRQEKLSTNIGYARSRAASRMARKRLSRAKSLAKPESSGDFFAEISQAVLSYVADKLNISPHGLTSDRVAELLTEKGADRKLIDDTVGILRKSDFARFAPSSVTAGDIEESLATAENVMVRMEGVKFA